MLSVSQWLIMYLWQRVQGLSRIRFTNDISPQILCYQEFLSQWPPLFLSFLSNTSPEKVFLTSQDESAMSTNTISLQCKGHHNLFVALEMYSKSESVLDFRNRNLWYIDLESSNPSLALKIRTQWVCPFFEEN